MADRVIIDGSGAIGSPLRISVAGIGAASAQFNDLIFDGNQPPLRLWGTGFVTVGGISFNDRAGGKNVNEGTNIAVLATPAGTSSVFGVLCRNTSIANPDIVQTPQYPSSGGGGLCSNVFCPVNFLVGGPAIPTTPGPDNKINYVIFKNYN